MLRPQDTARERKNLDGLWRFTLDQHGDGRQQDWYLARLPVAREMAVPASHNDVATDAAVRDHVGSVWYQRIANEPESHTEAAEEYFKPLFEVARQADPTRPVGFVNVGLAPHGKCRVSQFGDVLMLNRYYGWYINTGDLAAAEDAWEAELTGWASEGKPIIITEYGADTYPGLHSAVANSPWTEEYQVEYLDMNHRVFDRIDAVVGEQVWVFADFTTTSGIMRVGGNRKGVFTRDRQPKAARMPCECAGARTPDSPRPTGAGSVPGPVGVARLQRCPDRRS
jgi:beta-galactosidase/beta-glucuronidase